MIATAVYLSNLVFLLQPFECTSLDGRVFGISIKDKTRPLWTLWTRLYRRIFDLEKFPSQEIPIGKKERKML